jgi:DNA-binding MarR family transcriptional regulator/GNAT superfamily N-acetyltransferase
MGAVDEVRAFNRFYTRVLGLLEEGLLETPYSLTEARVLFELARQDRTALSDLRGAMGVDAGYLSRILGRFDADGLLRRQRSAVDARQQVIELTRRGRSVARTLDARSARQVQELLDRLTADDQRRLMDGITSIRGALKAPDRPRSVVLRAPVPGDLGWVVSRHGAVYAEEYGWDESFEAIVARVVADYADQHDSRRAAGWIAELAGARAGCVFCLPKDERTAQLRLLLVEPSARGAGLGTRLVEECLRFARRAGYEAVSLWTNDVLADARRIYERAGFAVVDQNAHHSFGQDLVDQTWVRSLSAPDA